MSVWNWSLLFLCLALSSNLSEGAIPVFVPRGPISINLNESTPVGTHLVTVLATDSVQDHTVTYSLTNVPRDPDGQDYFEINSTSGVIKLATTIDREKLRADAVSFEAVASDNVNNKAQKTIYYIVADSNDNFPVFDNLPYQVNVSEATKVDEVVLTVSASDKDSSTDQNNALAFEIVSGSKNNTFRIDAQTGQIILQKPLDYESCRIYHLNVTASDRYGKPTGNTNWTLVTIMVTNEDDHPAVFSKFSHRVLIDKDFPKGLTILQVHAEDQDATQDPVSYSIFFESDPEQTFLIDNKTGSITVNKNLTQTSYSLIVLASTTHHPPAFSLVEVNVGSMPNTTFETSVLENEANIAIFDLKPVEEYFNISDPVVQIVGGNDDNKFAINSSSKEIQVGPQGLNREETSQYSLVIKLMKNGKNKGFAKLLVHVLDTNDNAPLFVNPASVSLREDARDGTVITIVTANDRDAGNNGTVVYGIITGNEEGLFALNNQSGMITLAKQLDRETAVQYVLNISASDMGEPRLQTFTDVTIHVTDVNDNSPVLGQKTVRVSITEDTAVGSFVVQINATDEDEGENARITYQIVEGAAAKFSIDNTTGVITTTAQFDRGNGPTEYVVVISARDNGQSPRRDVVILFVDVTSTSGPSNNHAPVISPLFYLVGVYIETSYYSVIATVKATDSDSGAAGSISYKFANNNGADLFRVEPETGDVRTVISLADLAGRKYTLTIKASDGGNPAKDSTENAVVDIYVLQDENAITMKVGVDPQEITSNRTEFLEMLRVVTGGDAIIKYLRQENGERTTLVIFHAVKDKQVMTPDAIIRSISAEDNQELLKTTFGKWNISSWYQSNEQPSVAARVGTEDELNAVVGAMICLGVMIFVLGIILIIILIRRKRAGKSPFKSRRSTRVTFRDKPEYIDPDQTAVASNQVETAQEAQEVILHLPPEGDTSSLEGSETSSTRSGDVVNFVNFGYALNSGIGYEDDSDEANEVNLSTFFPPPSETPPAERTNYYDDISDENEKSDEEHHEHNPDDFLGDYEVEAESPEMLRPPTEVLGTSPDSTTGSTDQLVAGHALSNINFMSGLFMNRFNLNEDTTEL